MCCIFNLYVAHLLSCEKEPELRLLVSLSSNIIRGHVTLLRSRFVIDTSPGRLAASRCKITCILQTCYKSDNIRNCVIWALIWEMFDIFLKNIFKVAVVFDYEYYW